MLEKIWANGVEYKGWDANAGAAGTLYPSNTPSWFTTNVGGGPLIPASFNSYDIICAKGSNPSNISAPAFAGSVVTVKWWMVDQPFPEGHHGPVIDYIASCNGPCSKVNPLDLKFVKIAQRGWINNSTYAEGFWATNQLIANNGTWPIKVPSELKAGEYIIRHELLALHVALNAIGKGPYYKDGGESYPQCISIKVGGTGTKSITGGISAESLYRGDEPGLAINIHTSPNHQDYIIPGPPVWSGA